MTTLAPVTSARQSQTVNHPTTGRPIPWAHWLELANRNFGHEVVHDTDGRAYDVRFRRGQFKPDMARFKNDLANIREAATKPGFVPVSKTKVVFGKAKPKTIFNFHDFDGFTSDGRCGYTTYEDHACLWPIDKRMSKTGWMVHIKGHTLADLCDTEGGRRYVDKLVSEADDLLPVMDFDRPGQTCTQKEWEGFEAGLPILKVRKNPLYGDLGLRIKLFHGNHNVNAGYDRCVHRDELGEKDAEGRKPRQRLAPRPLVQDDDWVDLERRKLNPTLDNLDAGKWHSHGAPQWLPCERGAKSLSKDVGWWFAGRRTYQTRTLSEADLARRTLDRHHVNGQQPRQSAIVVCRFINDVLRKQVDEAYEYTRRSKGVESYADFTSWDTIPHSPPAWPAKPQTERLPRKLADALLKRHAQRQVEVAWTRALDLADRYDRVAAVEKTPPEWVELPDATHTLAHTHSAYYAEAMLKEADTEAKAQIGLWARVPDGWQWTRNWHPAAKQAEGDGPTALSVVLEARNKALARMDQLAATEAQPTNDVTAEEAFEEDPSLRRVVEGIGNLRMRTHEQAWKVLCQALTMRMTVTALHVLDSQVRAGEISQRDRQRSMRRLVRKMHRAVQAV